MATSGKKHWPPMGRTQWPLTHTHQTWPARLDDVGPRGDINAGGLRMPRVLVGRHCIPRLTFAVSPRTTTSVQFRFSPNRRVIRASL